MPGHLLLWEGAANYSGGSVQKTGSAKTVWVEQICPQEREQRTKLATGKAMLLLRDPADRTVKTVTYTTTTVEEHSGLLGKQARPSGVGSGQ